MPGHLVNCPALYRRTAYSIATGIHRCLCQLGLARNGRCLLPSVNRRGRRHSVKVKFPLQCCNGKSIRPPHTLARPHDSEAGCVCGVLLSPTARPAPRKLIPVYAAFCVTLCRQNSSVELGNALSLNLIDSAAPMCLTICAL